MAQLGQRLFSDPRLSSSGRLSCATCHRRGARLRSAQRRSGDARRPRFDAARDARGAVPDVSRAPAELQHRPGRRGARERRPRRAVRARVTHGPRAQDRAGAAQSAANLVPQGGLFWDGRADTLQSQALWPLLTHSRWTAAASPRSRRSCAGRRTPTASSQFSDRRSWRIASLVSEALFARRALPNRGAAFHPYSSKFDAGSRARRASRRPKLRGYRALQRSRRRANCAACHRRSADGRRARRRSSPITSTKRWASRATRRSHVNRDPRFFDLGFVRPVAHRPTRPDALLRDVS